MTRDGRLYLLCVVTLVAAVAFARWTQLSHAREDATKAEQLRVARAAQQVADAKYKAVLDSLQRARAQIAAADSAAAKARLATDRARASTESAIASARRAAADMAATDSMLRAELVTLAIESEGILAAAAEERRQHGVQLTTRDWVIFFQGIAIAYADTAIAARDTVIAALDEPKPAWWRRALVGLTRPICAAGGGAIGALVAGVGGAAFGAAGGSLACGSAAY